MNAMTLRLFNQRTDDVLAERVEVAVTRRDRRKGLLGRSGLDPASAIIIAPCFSIHTLFMRFDIDVIFVDEDGRVLKVLRDMTPWRIAGYPTAHAVVELAAGSLRDRQINVGDRLYLLEPDGRRVGLFVDDLREVRRAEPPLAA
jgi:uncharacterized membrane protein (UPF0127 family)